MAESILLTAARVSTFDGDKLLTGASGFFFLRDERLFFVTSRHVVIDAPTKHFPNRLEIELHTDAVDLTQASVLSVWLYDGKSMWRQGSDTGGEIDVATIELDRAALPPSVAMHTFTPAHAEHAGRGRSRQCAAGSGLSAGLSRRDLSPAGGTSCGNRIFLWACDSRARATF
jgi:hypothetical protein